MRKFVSAANSVFGDRQAWPATIVGAALGALGALLAAALGVGDLLSIEPPHGVVLGTVLAAGIARFGHGWVVLSVDGALLILYLIVAFSPLTSGLSRSWVRRDARPHMPLDAIVVLSSSILPDSGLDALATERLLTGIELWRARVAPRLVTTRVSSTFSGIPLTSDADQKRLLDLADAHPPWIVVDHVASTRDEAVASRRVLGELRRIAVVTSPLHTRRACRAFERSGFYVYCVPARERAAATVRPHSPTQRLLSFRGYVYERAASAWYRWNKWA